MIRMFMALYAAFAATVGPLTIAVLSSLGLGLVTYVGGTSALSFVQSSIASNMGALPANIIQWLGVMHFDQFVSMIMSAYVFRFSMDNGAGVLKRVKGLWGQGKGYTVSTWNQM